MFALLALAGGARANPPASSSPGTPPSPNSGVARPIGNHSFLPSAGSNENSSTKNENTIIWRQLVRIPADAPAYCGIRIAFLNGHYPGANHPFVPDAAVIRTATLQAGPIGHQTILGQFTWSRSKSHVFQPGEETKSDPLPVCLQPGTDAFIAGWTQLAQPGPGAFPLSFSVISPGEAMRAGNGLADNTKVAGDSYEAGTAAAASDGPFAVYGVPANASQPGICLVGDSLTAGLGDSPTGFTPLTGDGHGDYGAYQRAVWAAGYGMAKIARSGTLAQDFHLTTQWRDALWQCSRAVILFGTNDLYWGLPVKDIEQSLLDIWMAAAVRTGHPAVARTLPPRTASVDQWATTTGQTVRNS
ncbi:MAG TPA: SGNH/GDSL hydrolase family protein, partial [Acetobacteraceae bacterium]|nr:SGNH/GDSL hydrolase family protein [Acetobacteraceae bacterium]